MSILLIYLINYLVHRIFENFKVNTLEFTYLCRREMSRKRALDTFTEIAGAF